MKLKLHPPHDDITYRFIVAEGNGTLPGLTTNQLTPGSLVFVGRWWFDRDFFRKGLG